MIGIYGKISKGDKMKSLYDLTFNQLRDFCVDQGWKKFRGQQIFEWLYRKRVNSIDEMSDLSLDTREKLKEMFTLEACVVKEK